jgi:hypothetical protein
LNDPDTPDGEYYLDPNLGSLKDSIQVNCSFSEKTAYVQPKQEGGILHPNLKTTLPLSYTSSSLQLKSLQSVCSVCAHWNFSLQCPQSITLDGSTSKLQFTYPKPYCDDVVDIDIISDSCSSKTFEGAGEITIRLYSNHPECLPPTLVNLKTTETPDVTFSYTVEKLSFCL